MITAREIADHLQEVFRHDPQAIAALFLHHVPCNQALADHPAAQVKFESAVKSEGEKEKAEGGGFSVSPLGIFGGLCNADGGYLCMIFALDEHKQPIEVLGFGVSDGKGNTTYDARPSNSD